MSSRRQGALVHRGPVQQVSDPGRHRRSLRCQPVSSEPLLQAGDWPAGDGLRSGPAADRGVQGAFRRRAEHPRRGARSGVWLPRGLHPRLSRPVRGDARSGARWAEGRQQPACGADQNGQGDEHHPRRATPGQARSDRGRGPGRKVPPGRGPEHPGALAEVPGVPRDPERSAGPVVRGVRRVGRRAGGFSLPGGGGSNAHRRAAARTHGLSPSRSALSRLQARQPYLGTAPDDGGHPRERAAPPRPRDRAGGDLFRALRREVRSGDRAGRDRAVDAGRTRRRRRIGQSRDRGRSAQARSATPSEDWTRALRRRSPRPAAAGRRRARSRRRRRQ